MKTEKADSTIETITNNAGERAKHYVDVSVDAINTASDKARKMTRTADSYVRDNPWVAVGVAAGAGMLIGYILRGRRSS